MSKAYNDITNELQQIIYLIDFWCRNDGTAHPKVSPSFSYSDLANYDMTMWFSAFYQHFDELNRLIQNLNVKQRSNENIRALRIFIEAAYGKLSTLRIDIENELRDCSYGQDKKECRICTNGLMSEAVNYVIGQEKDIRELYSIFTNLCNSNINNAENLTDTEQNAGNTSVVNNINIINSPIGSMQAGVNNKPNSNAEQHKNSEEKKSVFWKIISWVAAAIAGTIIVDIFGNFGWLKIIRNLLSK